MFVTHSDYMHSSILEFTATESTIIDECIRNTSTFVLAPEYSHRHTD